MRSLVTVAMVLGLATFVYAQGYPAKPIRAVVGYAPGGQIDAITRIVAYRMGDGLKQPLVVENRPGAGSSIAADAVSKSAPDGYTIYFTTNAVAVNHVLSPKTAPDPLTAFTPVSLIATAESVLLANAQLPVRNVSELTAWAKVNAGRVNYATTSIGSPAYVGMELFKHLSGMQAEMILYKDVNQAGSDTSSGRVQLWMTLLTPSLPLIQAGKLRPLAVTGSRRMTALPDVPTFAEIGFPTLKAASWYAILAPAGTPREVVLRLNSEVKRVLQVPEVKEKLANLAIEPSGSTPDEAGTYLSEEMERTRLLVKLGALKSE